jgi:polar amino acid transport system substrate-binding protein
MKNKLLFFTVLLTIHFTALSKQTLNLATTQWCPYTCDFQGSRYGIVGEIIVNTLKKQGILVTIESYPWSRAVNLADTNKIDGLLTATMTESTNLLFSNSPIGSYQMCFYTREKSQWSYKSAVDFEMNKLLVIQDYGYGEPLDSYIKTKAEVLITLSGEEGLERSIKMLQIGRADIIIEDKRVIQWFMAKNKIEHSQIREAGCLVEQPFYLALSPTIKNKELLKTLENALIVAHKKFNLTTLK